MEAESLELIKRIASVVGHELRNPLAVINNSAYFLKNKLGADGKLDPKVEKHLGIVGSEIGRMDRMIADILAYARPVEPSAQTLELEPLLSAALKALPAAPGLKVVKKLSKGATALRGDGKLIADVLRRLLENAVEAMPGGGTLGIVAGREAKFVVIEVSDTGEGVKAELVDHLFEPFRTGKPRGLGLSLAISRRIAQAHGGTLEFLAGGQGARFRLSLPAAA